jgi:hypothetical protein
MRDTTAVDTAGEEPGTVRRIPTSIDLEILEAWLEWLPLRYEELEPVLVVRVSLRRAHRFRRPG